jgi:uncharacterized protein YbbC (DUF1343 family)
MDQKKLIADLTPGMASCGVAMRPYRYRPQTGAAGDLTHDGILFSVASPDAFYPVTAGILLFAALVQRHGAKVFQGARTEWMDKLYGSCDIRDTLEHGSLTSLFESWIDGQDRYLESKVDLYR